MIIISIFFFGNAFHLDAASHTVKMFFRFPDIGFHKKRKRGKNIFLFLDTRGFVILIIKYFYCKRTDNLNRISHICNHWQQNCWIRIFRIYLLHFTVFFSLWLAMHSVICWNRMRWHWFRITNFFLYQTIAIICGFSIHLIFSHLAHVFNTLYMGLHIRQNFSNIFFYCQPFARLLKKINCR